MLSSPIIRSSLCYRPFLPQTIGRTHLRPLLLTRINFNPSKEHPHPHPHSHPLTSTVYTVLKLMRNNSDTFDQQKDRLKQTARAGVNREDVFLETVRGLGIHTRCAVVYLSRTSCQDSFVPATMSQGGLTKPAKPYVISNSIDRTCLTTGFACVTGQPRYIRYIFMAAD